MRMFRKINIEEIESGVLEWLEHRKYRLLLFVFMGAMLWVLAGLPYINLFFNLYLVIFIAVVLAAFVLDINARLFFIVAPALLVVAFLAWFVDKDIAARLVEYIFIILLSGILRTLFSAEAEKEDKIRENDN